MLPERIKIGRYAPIPGDDTDRIGRCADGTQFMAFVILFQRKLYALLHRFDAQGKHLGTQAAVHAPDALETAEQTLDAMLEALSNPTFEDIEIKPFSVRVDGHDFGLLDATIIHEGKPYPRLLLQPNDLLFTPPWDGSFES